MRTVNESRQMKRMAKLIAGCLVVACAACADAGEVSVVDWLHAEASVQVASAYQLYGALFNDEPVCTYAASINADLPWQFSVGGGMWTLNDLTSRNKELHSRWNNETDYDLHLAKSIEVAPDCAFNLSLGYLWMVMYHSRQDAKTQRSIFWSVDFENPCITPFAAFEYQHAYSPSLFAEAGVRRRFALSPRLSLTPSASLSAMGEGFKESFFPEGEYSDGLAAGFVRIGAEYKVSEYVTLFGKMCWCSLLDGDIRRAVGRCAGGTYKEDFMVAEIGASVSF